MDKPCDIKNNIFSDEYKEFDRIYQIINNKYKSLFKYISTYLLSRYFYHSYYLLLFYIPSQAFALYIS